MAVVLAAGKGTRLRTGESDAPKVMREVCGRPLLWYVLEALSFIGKENIVIVVGYMKDAVMDYFSGYRFAQQAVQLGTGHAVMSAEAEFKDFGGSVLVCYGDMPVITKDTYSAFLGAHFEQGNDCTILTGESELRLPYGRIIRDSNGGFKQIVEEKDCSPEELRVTELNSGVYAFRAGILPETLKSIKNENTQGEYYVTEAPAIMLARGAKIGIFKRDLREELIGVNTLEDLSQVEKILLHGGI